MRSLALGLVAVVASCASLPSSSSVPSPAEDSSASVSLQQLRTSMRVSLEAVGWAEAALPNARYHIAVLSVQRMVVESANTVRAERETRLCPAGGTTTPAPAGTARQPATAVRCDPTSGSGTTQQTPAATNTVPRTIRGFAIRRVSDGAVFWRTYLRIDQAAAEQAASAAILELVMGR